MLSARYNGQTLGEDSRNSNTIVKPQSSTLVRDVLEYEIFPTGEGYETSIDAAEHISDRLYRTALLVREPWYNRNNCQRYLSDYASSTSSSVRDPNQIKKNKRGTYVQHQNQLQIQSVGKSQRFDRSINVYHDLVETSSTQTQYQVQHKGSKINT